MEMASQLLQINKKKPTRKSCGYTQQNSHTLQTSCPHARIIGSTSSSQEYWGRTDTASRMRTMSKHTTSQAQVLQQTLRHRWQNQKRQTTHLKIFVHFVLSLKIKNTINYHQDHTPTDDAVEFPRVHRGPQAALAGPWQAGTHQASS